MNPIPPDHPYRRELARLEKDASEAITDALAELRKELFAGINRENVDDIIERLASESINEALRQRLYNALLPTVELGAVEGRRVIEREVLGVKVSIFDPEFNWELVNEAARDWLRTYTFNLVRGIDDTTARGLRRAIDDFVQSPSMTVNELGRQISPLFGVDRADMIAITEVTRSFAAGNLEAWRGSGVIEQKRWNTARDELVCPICAPLNGRIVGMDDNFGNVDAPPAHPRCRCWLTPVVTIPEAVTP
jgi:SPP1 gp7 family putative phage head morphogenesis protein